MTNLPIARAVGTKARTNMRICLAASGGGHVRQLLDLEQVWKDHDHFFVTEDTALGRTLSERHRTYFVPHFAWGQAKLGNPFRMLRAAVSNLLISGRVILAERPDLVISTGAGAVIFTLVWARLLGARTIGIESFARFHQPSLFGRVASKIAHDFVVQSTQLGEAYPKARVFDPFRMLDGPVPPKSKLLFATVGATLPFDRLVHSVATLAGEGAISDRIVVQTGEGGLAPPTLETHESLPFHEVQEVLREARVVVCHGGTGSLITALREGCHVIAMPRLEELGEHYDNHQEEITQTFADRGLIQVARTIEELRVAVAATDVRPPVMATTDPTELRAFVGEVISKLQQSRVTSEK